MQKTKLSTEQLDVVQQNSGLKRYLESLLQRKDSTPRSWLYESVDANAVLHAWQKRLDALKDADKYSQEVFQFDTSQLEKWGPQGGHPPIEEALDDVVLPTFKGGIGSPAFKSEEWQQAKEAVIAAFKAAGIRGLRPASYRSVVDDMRARDTLESNSGWPLFTRRSKPEVVKQSIQAAEDGSWKDYPAIALFRYYNRKLRLVWMFPMSANLKEGSYCQVLQSRIINSELGNTFFAPWVGFEQVRSLVTKAYEAGQFVAASDFSSTDAHFTWEATEQVCDVIKTCFQRAYWDDLTDTLKHMHNIPLVIGPDEVITGEHGVSSGSNWTNFVETIFDFILSKYVSILTKQKWHGLYAIGDDMSWVTDTYDEGFNDELATIGKSCGQEIKAEKTTNDRDKVKTLQRLFQRGYVSTQTNGLRGVYSTIRALKSSIYPERFHNPKVWSKDMFCARQFMILENTVDHPLFEEFVKFVCKGNDALIPFAQKSAKELDTITRASKLIPGLNPTYNQEKRDTSLASFASIRIAASS